MNVETKNHETFDSLFSEILHNDSFKYRMFRGESSANYKLVPRILRSVNEKPIICQTTYAPDLARIEYELLDVFYINANKNGLKLPINEKFKAGLSAYQFFPKDEAYQWIASELAEVAALAQHYGVPTRLLDWTYNPLTAFYFAVSGVFHKWANKKYESNDYMVIWELSNDIFFDDRNDNPFKLVVPPYYDNPNLNAQKGVLTYWETILPGIEEESDDRYSDIPKYLVDRTPIDILIEKRDVYYEGPILRKHILPVSQCFNMYKAIKTLGYTAAKIFPGYKGVVQQMEEDEIADCFYKKSNLKGDKI